LIADEPTGNLDEKNSDIVADLFGKIKETTDTTILLATHSTKFASIANNRYELANKQLNQLS
jgi:ABC-type lipoprotein export system ATPase subunit